MYAYTQGTVTFHTYQVAKMLTNRKNHYIKVKAPVGAETEDAGVGCLDIWNALPSIPLL